MEYTNFRLKLSLLRRRTQRSLPEKLTIGLENLERKFLELKYLKLSHIIDRLNFANDFFNSVLFSQIDFEQITEYDDKILKSGITLLDKLNGDLSDKVELFESSKSDNIETLSFANSLFLKDPRYCDQLLLDIPGFYYDQEYTFDIYVEGLKKLGSNSPSNVVRINKTIFPFRYGGKYKDKINIDDDFFISKFKPLSYSEISIIDQDNVKVNYDYEIVDGYIKIDTTRFSNDQTVIEYTPHFEDSVIDTEGIWITKVNLSTNYSGGLKKNIAFKGGSHV